jgi:glycosyltransferase involved in cell wall biosynthesis
VSNAGGAIELTETGYNALLSIPGDAAHLANCIRQLATDASLRTRLGNAGRVTAEARFDRSRLATELVPIYRASMLNEQLPFS